MNKDGVYVFDDITADNIRKITRMQSRIAEQRICEIFDLARDAAILASEMLSDGYGIYEILSIISDGFSLPDFEADESSLKENLKRLSSYFKLICEYDKIVFTELFADMIAKMGILISEKDFLLTSSVAETFTYVRNSLADEAYDVFSQAFSDPRVRYSSSLAEAAKAVSTAEVGFALLPLEEKGGARLASVAELLFKEDLKIYSVTPVFGFEGLADMKYALVSKHFCIHEVEEEDDRYLEIRLRADSSILLSELLSAASSFGASVYRVNTISFETDDGSSQYYSVVFRDEGKDFSLLLIYLTLFSGAYTPIGLYKNLE
ncbi:MAG: hypothetical protein E7612_11005 [Ruminococcaceae bacterium]|nr:hypothetical protein [Oscillospiraceae bacterium]